MKIRTIELTEQEAQLIRDSLQAFLLLVSKSIATLSTETAAQTRRDMEYARMMRHRLAQLFRE